MKNITSFLAMTVLGASALMSVSCATQAGNGALIGGGTGALVGGIIGHQSGHTEGGALIGGAVGALGGAAIGNAQDQNNYNSRRIDEMERRRQYDRGYDRGYDPRY
jgi:uncharacterized protein YcfJ